VNKDNAPENTSVNVRRMPKRIPIVPAVCSIGEKCQRRETGIIMRATTVRVTIRETTKLIFSRLYRIMRVVLGSAFLRTS
jgi:hypothetical protein